MKKKKGICRLCGKERDDEYFQCSKCRRILVKLKICRLCGKQVDELYADVVEDSGLCRKCHDDAIKREMAMQGEWCVFNY